MKKHSLSVSDEATGSTVPYQDEYRVLQKLLASSLDVICSIDTEGRFTYVSPAAEQVWGYSPQEVIGKKYMDMVVPEDHPKTEAIAQAIILGKEVTSFENRYCRKDGAVVPILWSARWSADDQTMYCVAKDATQIKKAELQNNLQEKRLKRAYRLAEIAWWEYDVATQTFTSSNEIFEMYGIPLPENCQTSLEDFLSYVHPDDRPRLQQDLSAICKDTYFTYEHRVVKPSGESIYVIHYSEVIRDGNGDPIALHGTTKDITKRKVQQLKLEESEQKLQAYAQKLSTILESIGDGFFATDKDWTVTYWNRKSEELLGKKKQDIVGKNLWQEYQDAIPLKFFTEYHRAVAENTVVQFEEYFPPLNLWVEVTAYPSAEGLSVFFKDITARKRQENDLKTSNERFELVCKATNDVIWDWNILNKEMYVNESFYHTFGHQATEEKNISSIWRENLFAADKDRVLAAQQKAINNPAVGAWDDKYRFRKANGEIAYVTDRAVILRNEEGKAIRMIGAINDITASIEQQERLEFMAKATSEVIWELDLASDKAQYTSKFRDVFGYDITSQQVHLNFWLSKVHPDDLSPSLKVKNQAFAAGNDHYIQEYRFLKSDGTWAYIKDRTFIIKNPEGQPISLIGAMEDVTQEKEAEKALQESEQNYRRLFANAPLPTLISDTENLQYLDANAAAIAHLGYSREELLKMSILDLRPTEEHEKILDYLSRVGEEGTYTFKDLVLQKKDGEQFFAEVSAAKITYNGKAALLATIKDVTENVRLQEELMNYRVNEQKNITRAIIHAQESERAEIGKELHDNVCQLLTTSKLYIENIKYLPEQADEFAKKGIELLMQSINEIRYLSKQLVSPVFKDIGFEASINELLNHYQSLNLFDVCFAYNADIETIDKDLKLSLIRILQEQFNNTVKYANASQVQVSISNSDDSLLLRYEDNGVGFDQGKVKGGIGLSNIRNRASAFGGTVKLSSAIGKGCKIEVQFPLKEKTEYSALSQEQLTTFR